MSSSPSAIEGSATSPVNRDGQRDRRFGKHGAKRGVCFYMLASCVNKKVERLILCVAPQ